MRLRNVQRDIVQSIDTNRELVQPCGQHIQRIRYHFVVTITLKTTDPYLMLNNQLITVQKVVAVVDAWIFNLIHPYTRPPSRRAIEHC